MYKFSDDGSKIINFYEEINFFCFWLFYIKAFIAA